MEKHLEKILFNLDFWRNVIWVIFWVIALLLVIALFDLLRFGYHFMVTKLENGRKTKTVRETRSGKPKVDLFSEDSFTD